MSLTIAFVAEGDANTADCWSGSGRGFVTALRAAGAQVDVFDAELKSWPRALVAALTCHPSRPVWRQRYLLGALPFAARSARTSRAMRARRTRYDAIIQVGATWLPDHAVRAASSFVLYCDSNLVYARGGAPFSGASQLTDSAFNEARRREQRVYDASDRIWTMSDAVSRSFRDDFAQPAAKMHTIYAGANNPPAALALTRKRQILFVGKDHARKGSAVLLDAFARVREVVPDAELHLVGGVPPESDRPGVVRHGVVSRATPQGSQLLDELFASSSVFCLPSRFEPFGIAFVEAMMAGLACVGTTRWAMPELIAHGDSGLLVADGSADELTAALIELLSNPARASAMGARGRERSALFTWERVANRAINDLEQVVARGNDRIGRRAPV